ncbi:hypothetical protein ACS0PU_000320 [Formica fusca]
MTDKQIDNRTLFEASGDKLHLVSMEQVSMAVNKNTDIRESTSIFLNNNIDTLLDPNLDCADISDVIIN